MLQEHPHCHFDFLPVGLRATTLFAASTVGMKVTREMGPEDGSWTNAFMASDEASFEIEPFPPSWKNP